jgi:hypothetical protein
MHTRTTRRSHADHDLLAPTAGRRSFPGVALRVEGAVLLVAAIVGYVHLGHGWGLFAALLLVPDVGMAGYLAGPVVGSRTYNATHWLGGPAVLGGIGLVTDASLLVAIALVWIAHVGMDRALGYGLKYPTHFRDTHLQRVA